MRIGSIALIAVVAILAIWVIGSYNGFIKLRNAVEEAFSTIDVYLKKRYDLIPNLVETVKGYATHEAETLEKVVEARNSAYSASTVEEKVKGDSLLSGALKSLFAVAEAYPDLKANTNFLELQEQLEQTENDLANARKYYNAVVKDYNTKLEMFPGNLLAGLFHFTRKPLFEVADAAERERVKVSFS